MNMKTDEIKTLKSARRVDAKALVYSSRAVAAFENEVAELRAKLSALEKQTPEENIQGLSADESAFIRWAEKEKYDLSCHPMFFVMLDSKTYAARMGWKAAKAHYAAGAAPSRQHWISTAERKPAKGDSVIVAEIYGDKPETLWLNDWDEATESRFATHWIPAPEVAK